MDVSYIFDPEPEVWGLRGDPYFWEHLKKKLNGEALPYELTQLEDLINGEYERLTGEALTPDSRPFVPEFSHGGISSGSLSGKWWLEQGIPLLRARLEKTNTRFEAFLYLYQ